MGKFWEAAGTLLKPSGTVALWTCSSLYAHPSTPNAAEVQHILDRLVQEHLAPYSLPSNKLSDEGYRDLVLPWAISSASPYFSKDAFKIQHWDLDGVLSDGKDFFCGGHTTTLAELASSLGTASMVTRWRQAHPDIAGGENDCVLKTMRDIAVAMNVEKGKEEEVTIRTGNSTSLLLFKRI